MVFDYMKPLFFKTHEASTPCYFPVFEAASAPFMAPPGPKLNRLVGAFIIFPPFPGTGLWKVLGFSLFIFIDISRYILMYYLYSVIDFTNGVNVQLNCIDKPTHGVTYLHENSGLLPFLQT